MLEKGCVTSVFLQVSSVGHLHQNQLMLFQNVYCRSHHSHTKSEYLEIGPRNLYFYVIDPLWLLRILACENHLFNCLLENSNNVTVLVKLTQNL